MRWSDLLATSLASLRQRAFRTSLTVLGVMIGTTAVIVMVSLGVGMSASFEESFQTSNLRQVRLTGVPPDAARMGLPDKLDDRMLEQMSSYPGVLAARPTYSVMAEAKVGGMTSTMQIVGMPYEALVAQELPLAWGTMPQPGAPLAVVLGDQVGASFWDEARQAPAEIDFSRETLFLTFSTDSSTEPPVDGGAGGGTLEPAQPPKRVLVPVAAELAGQGGGGWSEASFAVYADLDALRTALEKAMPGKALPNQPATPDGRPRKGFVYTDIRLDTDSPEAAEALLADLRNQGYQVEAEVEWIRQAQQQGMMIQAVFGGIGFISLLVAAIGIANTMLMSVYERTKEIGIMKVLGAALGDIRKLFVIESASIGLFGGLAGLALSLAVSGLLNATLGAQFMGEQGGSLSVVPLWLMLGAVAFATLIGTVAGLAPAQRATKLSPLAAIRSE